METGKNTSADRNRKQTGNSEEIVADSAICTCDKGSKPGTFRVTSQQKIYCNGARKLVATDQDKDIKSLNFGSCAAKNNGPCSPNIAWSNTYNKIAIKGKMYPLTVKSSGTCKAGGGRINIQTSGQQVVVKPSSSPRKANSTAHKIPVFTEEDWKHLPQEDEKSQNKRVPAAVQVNNVLVNGKREITITPYDQEELLFTTSLTAGSMRGTGVKWDVCHGNRVIAKGLTEAPARTYFTKEGTYAVYAYVHKPGSPKGKGVVRITVSYPKFKSLEWKDENGKPVTYIGLRNKVFAHVFLPGCKGIPVNCRFYYNGYEGKTYLSALTPMTLSAAGKVKIALSLSSDQLKKIKEDRKRFSNGQKIRIHLELSSRHWIENLTKASQHPILFNDKIEFRSLVIYKDFDCKEKLQGGIADSGSTIYVRVSTSNMETGKICLDVYKHETGNQEEESPKSSPVYSTSCPVNSTGVYKFSLTLAAPPYKEGTAYKVVVSWIFSSQSSNGNVNNNTDRQTSKEPKQYILKGKEILFSVKRHIPTPKAEPSKANVNRTEPEKGGCPRCNKDVTLEEIKRICVDEKGNCLIKDTTMIAAALPYLNQYRKKVGINTCVSKAHFLAQIAGETKFYRLQEDFTYRNWKSMLAHFSSYFESFASIEEREREAQRLSNISIQKGEKYQKIVANTVYGPRHKYGKQHPNKDDGWRYSGKGFKQIIWKGNYKGLQDYTQKNFGVSVTWVGNDNPFLLKIDPRDSILSALAYWKKKGINEIAHGITDQNVDNVTSKINESKGESIRAPRRFFFHNAIKVLHVKECLTGNHLQEKYKNCTFDGKFTAHENEVYIDVITPKNRDKEGPLVVFDNKKILFITHSLCRGTNTNRLKKGGNGDTPTGKTRTTYEPKKHVGSTSFGKYGLILLEGIQGEFLTATKNGRSGIAIHSGHTVGFADKINDNGMLMSTYGCIRVYNSAMEKLGELYTKYKKEGKKIFCYIEDYNGDINDVYSFYEFKRDGKDRKRNARSKKQ
ncbi:MAG: DUF4280 domain-containing protein [Prevotella sp.]|nr:DUF4280 domain-containing protein [Prevotella sp.]